MNVTAKIINEPITVQAELNSVIGAEAKFATSVLPRTLDYYTGDYEITSFCADPLLTTSLILPTNDKLMTDDVTIYSVPTSEEYNEFGGVTFTIGGQ